MDVMMLSSWIFLVEMSSNCTSSSLYYLPLTLTLTFWTEQSNPYFKMQLESPSTLGLTFMYSDSVLNLIHNYPKMYAKIWFVFSQKMLEHQKKITVSNWSLWWKVPTIFEWPFDYSHFFCSTLFEYLPFLIFPSPLYQHSDLEKPKTLAP